MLKKFGKFLRQHKLFSVCLLLALGIVLLSVFAPLAATHDPYASSLQEALRPPDAEHWFGTDQLGRDLYSRVIYGARTSLAASFVLVLCILVIGSTLGMLAGYFGGMTDAVIMRVSDVMMAFPGLVLAMAIAGLLGASLTNAILAITAVSWPHYARLARSLTLKVKNRDYVIAGMLTGFRTGHMLRRYILPMTLPTLVVTAATDIGKMMMELAALCFLGFGAQAPVPEWGLMINEGRRYMQTAPHLVLYPGMAMLAAVAVFNLLGDTLRDMLDPQGD